MVIRLQSRKDCIARAGRNQATPEGSLDAVWRTEAFLNAEGADPSHLKAHGGPDQVQAN